MASLCLAYDVLENSWSPRAQKLLIELNACGKAKRREAVGDLVASHFEETVLPLLQKVKEVLKPKKTQKRKPKKAARPSKDDESEMADAPIAPKQGGKRIETRNGGGLMGVGGEAVTEFEQIYRAYFQDVELYLRAISHNESLAEELTEHVFFQALNALPKFRGDCDVRTWLCSMARNAYLSHLRKERPSQPIDELEISDPKQAVEEQIMDAQQAMAVHRVLHDLPEPYKEVFSLRVFGQLSFGDIGSLFGRTANWACVTYHRARQKIRDEMGEYV